MESTENEKTTTTTTTTTRPSDAVEIQVDCPDSVHSASLSLIQLDDVPQSLMNSNDSKEMIPELDNKNDEEQDAEKALCALPPMLELAGQDFQGKSSFDNNPVVVCPKVDSDMSVLHVVEENCEISLDQYARAADEEELDYVSQFMPEPLRYTQGNDNCSETIREVSNEPVEDMIPHDPTGQQHYSMHRRCLWLEDAQHNATMPNSSGFWSPSNITSSSNLYASSADSKVDESSCLEVKEISSCRQLINSKQLIISPRNSGNSISTISKPSGIGLHLNSIINAMPSGCDATGSMKSAKKGYLHIEGRKLISVVGCHGPDERKPIYEQDDPVEELNPSSPKKKRKLASTSDDGDDCKRCNCKKTRCLKLYCDCFAAGIYCAEPCSCQDCFNRPEYEDTVLETRQQIESRNPLAFAPKIVPRITESPANRNWEDRNNMTPSSARHKRGCNCKKSMCLKKYCECYQANVGCSIGCRCEGCKNVYGRKEEYGMTIDVLSKRLESTFDEKLEMTATHGLLPNCSPHNFTPVTPSFQFSDHVKDASKFQFSARRSLPPPDSFLTLSQYRKSQGSPGNSNNHDMLLTAKKGIEDHQELDYSNVETTDGFSARCDEFSSLCDISTLPNPSCPITPVAQFDATKFQAVDMDEKLHDILDDDMPDILKDNSIPLNVVKVSSPNKKRISPPRSSLQELGSGSSIGLRSGRKFILQAVPSFPSLTPCTVSKDGNSHNPNDPLDGNSKK